MSDLVPYEQVLAVGPRDGLIYVHTFSVVLVAYHINVQICVAASLILFCLILFYGLSGNMQEYYTFTLDKEIPSL